jgi:antitoxin YefM
MASININLDADIQPVSDFRANAATIIEKVRQSGRLVVLTQRGRGTAVLLDIRRYQELVDENELLRDIHEGLEDVRAGRTVGQDELRLQLRARYAK